MQDGLTTVHSYALKRHKAQAEADADAITLTLTTKVLTGSPPLYFQITGRNGDYHSNPHFSINHKEVHHEYQK
jgi:hypothetical protein